MTHAHGIVARVITCRSSGRAPSGRSGGRGRASSRGGGSGRSGGGGGGARSYDDVSRPQRARTGESSSPTTTRNLAAIAALAKTMVKHKDAVVDDPETGYEGDGFRLVRCMPHLKRREADAAVTAGRVLVNGVLVKPSTRVTRGDVVTLDGKPMNWEPYANSVERELSMDGTTNTFVYLAYNKPRGVVCTVEPGQRTSLLYVLEREMKALKVRLFPVGRLDKDSSGLVLLTNDGRVSDALLDPSRKAEKEYIVDVHREVDDRDVKRLASGVVITTVQQRGNEETTAATQPCEVKKLAPKTLKFVLAEGRNRQIRKMCEALDYDVTRLHRVRIDELQLGDLDEGILRVLSADEMKTLAARVALRDKTGGAAAKPKTPTESRRRKAAIANEPTGWGAKIYKESHRD
jgi:23S rRNA pseudouridine2604 synthase